MIKINALKALVGSTDFKIIGVVVLYLLGAQLGLWFLFKDIASYPIWPPAGIAFALTILLGYRIWPAIFISSFITYVFVFTTHHIEINIDVIATISVISIANVFEALIGYRLYKLLIPSNTTPHEKTSGTFILLGITLLIASIGAVAFTISFHYFLPNKFNILKTHLISNYLSEIIGIWLFANFIIAWTKSKSNISLSWWGSLEAIAYIFAIGSLLYVMNHPNLSVSLERSFPFLIIPFMFWVAFRSNIQMATSVVLAISLFSIYITINSSGPFLLNDPLESLLILQLFVLVIGITVVLLSAAIYERQIASKKLALFNENLEEAVDKRTIQLATEIKVREKTEKKILIANDELRKTNEELDNFVYKVSHDLRAPISSILGLVNIAKNDNEKSNMLACINQIEKSAITQDNFIKDIIELTKNSRVKPKREKIDFEQIVNETFDYLKFSMNSIPPKPNLHLHQDKVFYSDKSRMKIIFNNIISNSIKYSDPDNIKIDIDITVVNGHAKIDIQDSGNGIEKKYQRDVFKIFFRATDKNAGSGLGLYIVKETIQKLKGNVSIESELNQGTTLKMSLPNMASRSKA